MNVKIFDNIGIDRVFDGLHFGALLVKFQCTSGKIVGKDTFFSVAEKLQEPFYKCLIFSVSFFKNSFRKKPPDIKFVGQTTRF